ncbi:MAG: aminotransferase class I/II-fold pyridoxal phosphate-dependent enzyme [Acidiferrobacterales bacterium]|nr:aminotransferase class I/II-fold pyridoxal phosphate-dependent enzyme [Acidiferrobacterales bacterium]
MSDSSSQSFLSRESLVVQSLGKEDAETGAIVKPIHLSTTYARRPDYSLIAEKTYIRDHGPTQEDAESVVCALEGGVDAISFASGLAACTAPFHALSAGDHIVISGTVYHGTLAWLEQFAESRGLSFTTFIAGDVDDFKRQIIPGKTKLAWVETPANPTWVVTDIAVISEIAGANSIAVAVDSTCATPVLTRPLSLGADLVCHSATKYLNGHSDVLAGMLVTAEDNELWQRIRQHRLLAGGTLGSLDAYLLSRGMRTLYVRVRQQCENALTIAHALDSHSSVESVMYPGLESHTGHRVATSQMSGGYGGMLSFTVPGGKEEAIEMISRARVFKRATSLGGVESVLEHRKSVEPPSSKTPDNLIRVSVGIENVDDLLADFNRMLG